jgi:predicted phosphohydrolase
VVVLLLHVLSDLHTEFQPVPIPLTAADVVVLAGDTGIHTSGLRWASAHFAGRTVVCVAGNHEYYGESLPNRTQGLRSDAQKLGVRFLENEALALGDVVLLGCTLWTDFALHGNVGQAASAAEEHVTDYRRVRFNSAGRYRRLRAHDTARLHAESLAWLRDEIPRHAGKTVVVVTHHAPSARSIPERFKDDPVSAAFASSLDEFVAASGVTLWVHGHVHDSADYCIGGTRVLCNPGGYPGVEPNSRFVPGLVVRV